MTTATVALPRNEVRIEAKAATPKIASEIPEPSIRGVLVIVSTLVAGLMVVVLLASQFISR